MTLTIYLFDILLNGYTVINNDDYQSHFSNDVSKSNETIITRFFKINSIIF